MKARLKEKNTNISHTKMPTWKRHVAFVKSNPYFCWYVILIGNVKSGVVYITQNREIGVYVCKGYRGNGVASWAIKAVTAMVDGQILANINPKNTASIKLFKKLGFKHIQQTYAKEF